MIFAVLHLNAYGPLTIPYIFALSLIFSLATLRDDRIELAVGAHTAQNWLSVGSIDSLVNGHTAFQITWPYLLAVVLHGILFYGLTRLLVRLTCDRRAS
jgi:membrane protease YdiL (CAAX protease family)